MSRSKAPKSSPDRDVSVIAEALDELDTLQRELLDSRIAQVHELVTSAAYRYKNDEEALEFLKNAFFDKNRSNVLASLEKASMCEEFLKVFPNSAEYRKEIFFGPSEPYSDEASGRIEYIGNNYTDEAFRYFSSKLHASEALIVSSFNELCEDVYSGKSEYGILPIENTDNSKLLRFYSLINLYDLKIVSVCSVKTSDNGRTDFALVKRSLEYPNPKLDTPDMLEFLVKPVNHASFMKILSAAQLCAIESYRIDSLPLSASDEDFTFCFMMKLSEKSRTETFLLYMSVDFPQYTPIGIFKYNYQGD